MKNDESVKEERHSKKRSIIKKVWSRIKDINWKDPLNRWKLLFFLVLTFFGITFSTYGAIAATSTNTFCASCHSMSPEEVTHNFTSHSQLKCVDCHIKPGYLNTIDSKIGASKKLYYTVTGTTKDPIYPTKLVEDKNCLKCHSENRMVTATGDLIVNHGGHIDAGIACVTCHAGVAHAKVVERGLNNHDTYDYWIDENAEFLISTNYTNPNMGLCIDCHDKVNNGIEPWKEKEYLLSSPPESLTDGHEILDREYTSNIILQALGKQIYDVEISMACETCHIEVATPENHQKNQWNEAHGGAALKQLDSCINCHEEAKWIRRVATSTIEELLNPTGPNLEFYVPDIHVVRDEARASIFCFTCHAERPPGHVTSDVWLTAHADESITGTDQQRLQCFVCHDYEKPLPEEFNAPTEVYCEFCHRTGFKERN